MSALPPIPPTTVTAPVMSAWSSKINWTQAVSGLAVVATLVSGGQLNITPEQQTVLVGAIAIIQGIVTWVLRTWFTYNITGSSAAKM
jgi:hypothetical protein